MRILWTFVLAACGAAPPPTRFEALPTATCAIAGTRDAPIEVRFDGVPIAAPLDERTEIRVGADARAARARLDVGGIVYHGDVDLRDLRVSLAQPLEHGGWLTVTEVQIVKVAGATAVVQPVIEAPFRLASVPAFTVACTELRIDRAPRSPWIDGTPLSAQTVHLLDAPGGDEVATVELPAGGGACGTGTTEAHVTAEADGFKRLRVPTSFGTLHAWALEPKLLPGDTGTPICGATSPEPRYVDRGRVCPHDTPLYVAAGDRVAQIGFVRASAQIDVLAQAHGRGEIARRRPGSVTPFVRIADIESCPTRDHLGR